MPLCLHAWPCLTQSPGLAQHLKAILKPELWKSIQEEKVLFAPTPICGRDESLTWPCPCVGFSKPQNVSMALNPSFILCVPLQERAAKRTAELEAAATEKDLQLAEKDGRIAYWEGRAEHADRLLCRIRKSKANAELLKKWELEMLTSQGEPSCSRTSSLPTSQLPYAPFGESPCHVAVL